MEPKTPARPIAYSLQFRGRLEPISPRVLEARATAPSQVLVTTVDRDGVAARFEPREGDEALLRLRLVLAHDDSFDEVGTITFGGGHALRFRTVSPGRLVGSPDPNLLHGAAVWEVERGEGQFEGARGRITSNFFVSDTGEVTDNHFGLIFVAPAPLRTTLDGQGATP